MSVSARADGLGNVERHLVAAERRAQLYALHHAAGRAPPSRARWRRLPRARLSALSTRAHALHELLGHRHAQLVHHELGVAEAGERPDAADHRDLDVLDALQELLQQVEIEHRLRDDVLGAGLHFPLEAADLLVQVQRAGIRAHADQQRGLRTHRVAADIEPVIQIVDDVDQADGVHVEHRGGVRIGAHARRIAGDADQVAHARGVRAEQLGLDAQNVAVAAAEVEHRFDAGLLLDELAGDLRAHAGAGARAVGHVDAVDAVLRRSGARRRFPGVASTPRGGRISTKATNLPCGQLGAQLGLFAPPGPASSACAFACGSSTVTGERLGAAAAASASPSGSA